MSGRAFLGVLALAYAAAGSAQAPAPDEVDPARVAVAREIVAVVLPPGQRQQIMAAILRTMLQNMVAGLVDGTPGLKEELTAKPQVKAVFDRFVARQQRLAEADVDQALPGLVEAYARAYARNFSRDDLVSIKAFVATEAGARFLQRGPALLADPDVAGWQRRLTEQGAARQQAEMAAFAAELKAARAEDGQ